MASPATYIVWTRCSDPQTRWFPYESGLSEAKARERMTVGNADAQRHNTAMIYLALPTGERPANIKPASPVVQAAK